MEFSETRLSLSFLLYSFFFSFFSLFIPALTIKLLSLFVNKEVFYRVFSHKKRPTAGQESSPHQTLLSQHAARHSGILTYLLHGAESFLRR